MIEQELYTFLQDEITTTDLIYWGKINRDEAGPTDTSVVFFKSPSFSSQTTPSYLDVFQISIFAEYVDTATSVANEIIELFQLETLVLGEYRCWVNNITHQGTIIDEEGVVQIPLQLELKYSGL
jgi:hypothetical protein